MEISGRGGTIRIAGRVAVRLAEWTLEGRTDDWNVVGAVEWCNPLWLSGPGPYELRLTLTKGAWLWRNVPVTLIDEGRGGVRIDGRERWTLVGV